MLKSWESVEEALKWLRSGKTFWQTAIGGYSMQEQEEGGIKKFPPGEDEIPEFFK